MQSRYLGLKNDAVAQRRMGISMTVIERSLGIPRSTLSGWFRNIELTEGQRMQLAKSRADGWKKARQNAIVAHNQAKQDRLIAAKNDALQTLKMLDTRNPALLDLAFAMLYWGEGAKNGSTSISSSDPNILRFVMAVLRTNYAITPAMVRCELHLRADQNGEETKEYWSSQLGVPLNRFKSTTYDKRTTGRPTYPNYKGVCLLYCGSIAIQRKLFYLYNLFGKQVSGEGA